MIRDSFLPVQAQVFFIEPGVDLVVGPLLPVLAVSYTHLRAHETVLDLVCRLLLEKKTQKKHRTELEEEIKTSQHEVIVADGVESKML